MPKEAETHQDPHSLCPRSSYSHEQAASFQAVQGLSLWQDPPVLAVRYYANFHVVQQEGGMLYLTRQLCGFLLNSRGSHILDAVIGPAWEN